ncbi:DUF2844 domain-containing protein [Bdellovibrio sp. NC01]|uniref:DUF2844 domain-containing protein n=1 Tax=Bdellovibrio sp. NC01 TaxID=2220073 RepID=UPI0011586D1D|nr:DUF2844 domain-containing protein [Bdellovibrio sp. NC01]QDK37458.1 hypothetical protein DOE51_07605 [Bdellovibrio sp. NC01]
MNRFLRSTIVIAATCAWTNAQAAALGENISSNSSLQAKVSAQSTSNMKTSSKTSSLGASYTVREITEDVRVIKEYVNSSGVVFAVSWSGTGLPDLAATFGSYYAAYKEKVAAKTPNRNRRIATVETADLVFSNMTVGASMKGMAYISKLLPAGLAPEDLQ